MALGVLTLIAFAAGASASEPIFVEEVNYVGPVSYTTGGDTGLQAAYRALGVAQSGRTIVSVQAVDAKGYSIGWDSALGKLKLYQGDNANASPAPSTQVPNATDLSAVSFRLLITSR